MGDSNKRESLHQLLDLIPDEREWKGREEEAPRRSRDAGFEGEDKKLELKLGLPGLAEEKTTAVPRDEGMQQESLALSLGYFPKPSKSTTNIMTTGTKRGFIDTVEAKTEGGNEQMQQDWDRVGCANKKALEETIAIASERKKGFSPPPPNAPPTASMCNSGNRTAAHGRGVRGASSPVVGWPPIRSFRRNLANNSSSKQSPELQNGEVGVKAKLTCKTNPLIKINMDGIPIGRKVDLATYDSYDKLSLAVRELFHGFLEAQKEVPAKRAQQEANERIFSQLLDGSGEYTLVYEDSEGNRMLVGDMPWIVFVSTAKRLRVLRSSGLSHAMTGEAPRRVADC